MFQYKMRTRPMLDADGGGTGGTGGGAGDGAAGNGAGDGTGSGTGAGDAGSGTGDGNGGGSDAGSADTTPPPADPPGQQLNADEIIKKLTGGLTEQINAAVAEAQKKSAMKPDELAEYERTQRLAELDKREKDIALRELRSDTAEMLAAKKLPPDVLDIVMGADKAATEKNIAAFSKTFDAAVQKQVTARLAGKNPQAGNDTNPDDSIQSRFKKALSGL